MTDSQLSLFSKFLRYSGIGYGMYQYRLQTKIGNKSAILRVINYHSVYNNEKKHFENQLKFYKTNFNLIKPGDLYKFFENNIVSNQPNLLITFDDGSLTQYQVALEILEKHDLKAIFFIPSQVIETLTKERQKAFAIDHLYFGELRGKRCEFEFMSPYQIKELSTLGHEVGSHTISHCRFSLIENESEIHKELTKPKKMFENLTGKPVRFFAYPKGNHLAYHPVAVRLSQELYDFAFFALRGINTHATSRWFLQRDPIHPSYSISYVKSLLRGDFDWIYENRMNKIQKRHNINA